MDPASEQTCRSLLTEYLIHHCFKNTAKAFINETKKLDACSNGILCSKPFQDNGIDKRKRFHPNGDDMDIDQAPISEDEDDLPWSLLDARKDLYDAIVQGNIPQAFDLIYRHFPSLAAQDPKAPPTAEPRVIEHNSNIDPSHLRYILFKMRCQQFIEIIRSSDSVQAIEFAKTYLRPQHKDQQLLRDEVSVLIAYSSPEESNYRHLLSQDRRQELADEVNTVVLALSNLKCETALERIQKQMSLVQKELGSVDMAQSNADDKNGRDKMSM